MLNLHSSMDRLETRYCFQIKSSKKYLHSSMDRLETENTLSEEWCKIIFTFQYG